jgi:hypothetical protein
MVVCGRKDRDREGRTEEWCFSGVLVMSTERDRDRFGN